MRAQFSIGHTDRESLLSNTEEVPTPTESITPSPTIEYEVLSPSSIRKNGVVIEVSFDILSSTFQFGIAASGLSPSLFPDQPVEGPFPLVNSEEFFLGDVQTPLALEPFGGGEGGRPGDAGTVIQGRETLYKLLTPLQLGETYHIIALVTFSEAFGFSWPVRFEIDITPQPEH
ncbi:MAG: hypothetical protein ACRDFQ_04805 [Anaerolineales bacterium]